MKETNLTDENLLEILADWSFWDTSGTKPANFAGRTINLPATLSEDLALIIQGVRRCGKSTLLMQLPRVYDLPLDQCCYCNFEDPRLLNDLNHTLLSRIVKITRERLDNDKQCYFFFDEIQNVKEWEKWLHTQLERPKNNYYVVTGSNSRLLSGEFGTSLTGRHISQELYPFSFEEYKQMFAKGKLENYLYAGGFPRVLTYENPKKLLQEYFEDIILRDVLKRVHARSPESIKQVAKMVFESCGSELSYRKIAASCGITVDTVKIYLEACESAYLLFGCQFFAFSEKKRQLRHKKYYPIDSGLRYAITNTTGRDLGKSLELMVFLSLYKTNEQVYYWSEPQRGEVDFVTVNANVITPYQVSWEGREERHDNALQFFYESFPQAQEAVYITKHNADQFL